jgi:hypothetical protein
MSYGQRGAGDFIISVVATAIGGLFGAFVSLTIWVITSCFRLIAFGVGKLFPVASDQQLPQPVEAHVLSTSVSEEDASSAAVAVAPADTLWSQRHNNVTRKRVELGKVNVDIWFYPNLGIARRTMRISNVKMAKMFGSRIKLTDMPLTASNALEVELQTIQEAEALIAEASKTKGTREIRPVKPVLSASATVSNPDNKQQELPVTETPKLPEPETVPKEAAEVRRPHNREVTYRGVLKKQGVESREDRKNGGTYSCYCIHLDDFALGTVHDIVGTDLERALKEANATIGDAIEVSLAGETKTPVKGKIRTKKIWSVIKINQKP